MSADRFSKIITASINGLEAELVTVETDITSGLPAFSLVGLPGSAVKESKERVRSAIVNSGCEFPLRRITVNLSPADTHKDGSHFDLPIAVGILAGAAKGDIKLPEKGRSAFFGELSLDGALNRTAFAVAMALGLQEKGVRHIFLPEKNLNEVSELPGLLFYPAYTLNDIVSHLAGGGSISPVRGGFGGGQNRERDTDPPDDFFDVKGQESVKRALVVAAAGAHDVCLTGPPGVGKSMLAKRISGILPPLDDKESREVTRIHSIAGENAGRSGLMRERPYRSPHHSATQASIIGGGYRARPGEISLAHRGVLFLDELPEFERRTLDMLRQPLEDRYVDLSRVGYKGRYPCDFLLLAAMNPCPCGYLGDPGHECRCTQAQIQRYRSKLSGPLLDRIDIHIRMSAVEEAEFDPGADSRGCMNTKEMRAAAAAAGKKQRERNPNKALNSRLSAGGMQKCCEMEKEAVEILKKAYEYYAFSVRARTKIIKVARTIADIDGSDIIRAADIAEAVAYRGVG